MHARTYMLFCFVASLLNNDVDIFRYLSNTTEKSVTTNNKKKKLFAVQISTNF